MNPSPAAPPLPRETDYLAFGIPSLDRLFGFMPPGENHFPHPEPFGAGYRKADRPFLGYCLKRSRPAGLAPSVGHGKPDRGDEAATFCIIGPDGTGKSLFALHLTQDYWARTRAAAAEQPKVIYASTDLSYDRAVTMWEHFWLHLPEIRRERLPFEEGALPFAPPTEEEQAAIVAPDRCVRLRQHFPVENPEAFAAEITSRTPGAAEDVLFIDLEATTSGDDWSFLHTLLAVLDRPAADQPRHLLVIDAVEGLETLVGERDAFGEVQSRRARIAQLVRAAADKCHLVFIVEEPKDGERLPEVFVADVVVRLRSELDRDYARRTVEFEKVRGQPHVRGRHDFRIRQGCTRTGADANPDDPEVGFRGTGPAGTPQYMSYLQVFPSLHQLSHETRPRADASRRPEKGEWAYASFGVYQMDAMLAQAGSAGGDGKATGGVGLDEMGLPAGSITTLVGNESTYKSQLARAFLSQCFRTRHEVRPEPAQQAIQKLNQDDPLRGQGVAVLLATNDIDQAQLREKMRYHLISADRRPPYAPDLMIQHNGLVDRVIVRRLEPHHLPAAVLMHIIRQLVAEAQRRLYEPFERAGLLTPATKVDLNRRVRLVVDDWSIILSTYPEVARDPLFLPSVLDYLRREGVTTLILATRPGNPNERVTEDIDREVQALRQMADYHLFTWHVPFFGERRVAITAIPSLASGEERLVRELRPGRISELPAGRMAGPSAHTGRGETAREKADRDDEFDQEALVVDPHFELYADQEEGRPTPVPLQVRLYAEKEDIPASRAYLSEVEHLFRQMFRGGQHESVVHPQYGATYDLLRELSYLQSEAKMNHTLVLQVDEFWAESRSELRRQERYMTARTVDRNDAPIRAEDPFRLFQLTEATADCQRDKRGIPAGRWPVGPITRHEFFDLVGYRYEDLEKPFPIYKVPFTWDFGFLVCNRTAWERAFNEHDHRTARISVVGVDDGGAEAATRNKIVRYVPRVEQVRVQDIWQRLWKIGIPRTDAELVRRRFGLPVASTVVFAEENESPPLTAHWTKLEPLTVKIMRSDGAEDEKKPAVRVINMTGNPPESLPPAGPGQPGNGSPDPRYQEDPVSWREFFGACKTIAKSTRYEYVPFDLDLMAVESFSCMVFEVWMSEAFRACRTTLLADKRKLGVKYSDERKAVARGLIPLRPWMEPGQGQAGAGTGPTDAARLESALEQEFQGLADTAPVHLWRPRTLRGQPNGYSLADLLGKRDGDQLTPHAVAYRKALYRTFLLLDEVFSASQLPDDNLILKPRAANPKAAASRHWYSTASAALAGAADRRGLTVVGLPGHFSVRGDWFLAVARGSRSPRLGERAMDILCSRRGNISRLQAGIGLPVRTTVGPKTRPTHRQKRLEYRTSLPYLRDDGQQEPVMYAELRKLGAYDPADQYGRTQNFFWFWRSTIQSYDVHARIWQKWLCAILKLWRTWPKPRVPPFETPEDPGQNPLKATPGESWWDGFKEYDHYRCRELIDQDAEALCFVERRWNERWDKFNEHCDGLIESLERASRTEFPSG